MDGHGLGSVTFRVVRANFRCTVINIIVASSNIKRKKELDV